METQAVVSIFEAVQAHFLFKDYELFQNTSITFRNLNKKEVLTWKF